jgi:hypothetical protein
MLSLYREICDTLLNYTSCFVFGNAKHFDDSILSIGNKLLKELEEMTPFLIHSRKQTKEAACSPFPIEHCHGCDKLKFNLHKSLHSTNKQTPSSESANELYRPSDSRLSAKRLSTFADKGCHVVSVTDPFGRILGFLDRSR